MEAVTPRKILRGQSPPTQNTGLVRISAKARDELGVGEWLRFLALEICLDFPGGLSTGYLPPIRGKLSFRKRGLASWLQMPTKVLSAAG